MDSRNHMTKIETFLWYVPLQDEPSQPDINRLIAIINDTDIVVVKYVELDPVMKDIGYFLDQEKNIKTKQGI